jgi:hypothetical protein
MKNKLIFVTTFIICILSCEKKIKKELNKKVHNPKIEISRLFYTKAVNDSLELESLLNVDIINGFRMVKLGLNIDSISYVDWNKNNQLEKYGILELNKKRHFTFLENKFNIKLTFYNGELKIINFNNIDYLNEEVIYDLFKNTYGLPNYINSKKAPNIIKEKKIKHNINKWSKLEFYEMNETKTKEWEWRGNKNSIVIRKATTQFETFLGYDNDITIKTNEIDKIKTEAMIKASKIYEREKNERIRNKNKEKMNEI